MKKILIITIMACISTAIIAGAHDWDDISIPADAGTGKFWELQTTVSDDFNYTFNATNSKTNFGTNNKWYNFYHNDWDGPGTTYWKYNHVAVDGSDLVLSASRWDSENQSNPEYPYAQGLPDYKMNKEFGGVNTGCVTSHDSVVYPVFVESSISVSNLPLASCFWLLSSDDTQEIDIIENYGGADYYKQFTHISHHSFVRDPFHDYQPRDWNSWWPDDRVNSTSGWGDWCWNSGSRRYLRLGVYWKDTAHFEYYIDGDLVRVMYEDAIATDYNGTWKYTYYDTLHPVNTQDAYGNNVGGMPVNYSSGDSSGYSIVTTYATGTSYSFSTLQAASNASKGYNVVDPGEYQDSAFTKYMDIIINFEAQDWLVASGDTATDSDLQDSSKNKMLVDWVRVYKPTTSPVITIQAEDFDSTNGSFNDGYVPYGFNATASQVNYGNKNDWMEFDINVTSAGEYEITYYTGTTQSNTSVIFIHDGTTISTDNLPNNGDWNTHVSTTAANTVDLIAGSHTIKLHAGSSPDWQWNMDRFTLTKVAEIITVTGVTLDESTLDMVVGDTMDLDETVSPSNAVDKSVTWSTNNSSVATVSSTGLVTANGAGSATITVTTTDGSYTATCSVSVDAVPGIITVQAEDFTSTDGTYNDGYVPYGVNDATTKINYVNSGDTAEYSISIPNDGEYEVVYYISTPNSGATISFGMLGSIWNTTSVVNNGYWDDYQALTATSNFNFTEGSHNIQLTAGGATWAWNLDRFTLERKGQIKSTRDEISEEIDTEPLTSENNELLAYPNPANDLLNIKITSRFDEGAQLLIFNSVGHTVFSGSVSTDLTQIDITNLETGVYFIRINKNNSSFTKKFVKH